MAVRPHGPRAWPIAEERSAAIARPSAGAAGNARTSASIGSNTSTAGSASSGGLALGFALGLQLACAYWQ